jgi:hypothetical protein
MVWQIWPLGLRNTYMTCNRYHFKKIKVFQVLKMLTVIKKSKQTCLDVIRRATLIGGCCVPWGEIGVGFMLMHILKDVLTVTHMWHQR